MFASVRTHLSSRYLVKRGTQQPRIFVSDYSAARMRAIAHEGVYNTEKEYAFSAGIVEGERARVY